MKYTMWYGLIGINVVLEVVIGKSNQDKERRLYRYQHASSRLHDGCGGIW